MKPGGNGGCDILMVTRVYVCMNYEQYDEVHQNIQAHTHAKMIPLNCKPGGRKRHYGWIDMTLTLACLVTILEFTSGSWLVSGS